MLSKYVLFTESESAMNLDHHASPGWLMMLVAVFVIGFLLRLASGNGKGVAIFLFAALGLGMVAMLGATTLYMARSVHVTTSTLSDGSTRTISVTTSGPAAPSPPTKPKKAP